MVDIGVFPVPEAREVYLLAHIGFSQHGLANHAACRYGDGGRRYTEAHRLELVDAVLQRCAGEIVGFIIEEFLAQCGPYLVVVGDIERQHDVVAVEAERRQCVDTVEQRIGGGGRCAVGIGIEVDGVAFEHQHPFAVAHAFPHKARVVVGIGQDVLVEFLHAAQFVLAEVSGTFPAQCEPHLAAENVAHAGEREFFFSTVGRQTDLHIQVGGIAYFLGTERDGVVLHQVYGIIIVTDIGDIAIAVRVVLGEVAEFVVHLLKSLFRQGLALGLREHVYRQRLATAGDLYGEGLVGSTFSRYVEEEGIPYLGNVSFIARLRYQITQVGLRGDGRVITGDRREYPIQLTGLWVEHLSVGSAERHSDDIRVNQIAIKIDGDVHIRCARILLPRRRIEDVAAECQTAAIIPRQTLFEHVGVAHESGIAALEAYGSNLALHIYAIVYRAQVAALVEGDKFERHEKHEFHVLDARLQLVSAHHLPVLHSHDVRVVVVGHHLGGHRLAVAARSGAYGDTVGLCQTGARADDRCLEPLGGLRSIAVGIARRGRRRR